MVEENICCAVSIIYQIPHHFFHSNPSFWCIGWFKVIKAGRQCFKYPTCWRQMDHNTWALPKYLYCTVKDFCKQLYLICFQLSKNSGTQYYNMPLPEAVCQHAQSLSRLLFLSWVLVWPLASLISIKASWSSV